MFVPIRAVPPEGFMGEAMNAFSEKALANEKQRLENKYLPLSEIIKAQNSMVYSNRFGDIGQYLRTIQAMTPMQKASYFSDPSNLAFHNQMLESFKSGMSNPAMQGNIITPQLLKQFGIGSSEDTTQNRNPLQMLKSLIMGQNQNNSTNPLSMLANSNVDLTNPAQAQAVKQNIPQFNTPPPMPASMAGFSGQNKSQDMTQDQQSAMQQIPDQQSTPQTIEPTIQSKPITTSQRNAYVMQMDQNNKLITNQTRQRADAAAAMELWLDQNRDRYAKALKNASKYSDIIGKGEKAWDILRDKDPEAYEDFKWMQHDFVPLIANNIRMMEGLTSAYKQRQELKDLTGAISDWQLRPKRALETFNKQIGTIQDVSDAVFQAAEPAHPGVRRKLLNIPKSQSEYVPLTERSPKQNKIEKSSITQEKLEYTAKKHGISVDEVKRRLGVS